MDVAEVARRPAKPEIRRGGRLPALRRAVASGRGRSPRRRSGGARLRRCRRCGTRVAGGTRTPHLVFTCETCGLPVPRRGDPPARRTALRPCVSGLVPPEIPDREVAAAAENEVRAALATHWRFVTSSTAQPYLDRIAKQVAARIPGSPAALARRAHRKRGAPHAGAALGNAPRSAPGSSRFWKTKPSSPSSSATRSRTRPPARPRSGSCGSDSRRPRGSGTPPTACAGATPPSISRGWATGGTASTTPTRLRSPRCSSSSTSRNRPAATCSAFTPPSCEGDEAVAETEVAHPTPFDRLRRIERTLGARVGVDDGRSAGQPRGLSTGADARVFGREPRSDPARRPAARPLGDDGPARKAPPGLERTGDHRRRRGGGRSRDARHLAGR